MSKVATQDPREASCYSVDLSTIHESFIRNGLIGRVAVKKPSEGTETVRKLYFHVCLPYVFLIFLAKYKEIEGDLRLLHSTIHVILHQKVISIPGTIKQSMTSL